MLPLACTIPSSPAAIRSLPLAPSIVSAIDDHGTAELIVTLTPASSAPSDVQLSRTSGNAILDAAALRMARQAQVSPETQNCAPIGGQYFVEIEY